MNGIELLTWRRERKLNQAALATMLGVSRKTLVNWERGIHRLPMDIGPRLERLAYTLAPKPVAPQPEYVTQANAHLRPDLKLYLPAHKGGYPRGPDHPEHLGFKRDASDRPLPWSILDSMEYAEARQRAADKAVSDMEARERHAAAAAERVRLARIDLGYDPDD